MSMQGWPPTIDRIARHRDTTAAAAANN